MDGSTHSWCCAPQMSMSAGVVTTFQPIAVTRFGWGADQIAQALGARAPICLTRARTMDVQPCCTHQILRAARHSNRLEMYVGACPGMTGVQSLKARVWAVAPAGESALWPGIHLCLSRLSAAAASGADPGAYDLHVVSSVPHDQTVTRALTPQLLLRPASHKCVHGSLRPVAPDGRGFTRLVPYRLFALQGAIAALLYPLSVLLVTCPPLVWWRIIAGLVLGLKAQILFMAPFTAAFSRLIGRNR
eukprot:985936-Pleurochrysis_carterae.AAC.2